MLESRIEDWLKHQVEKRGGLYYKFTSPGNVGVPDRIIVQDGHIYFVELKQEKGVLSEIQKVQIRKLVSRGAEVRVIYGTRGAHELIEELYGERPGIRAKSTKEHYGIEEWR